MLSGRELSAAELLAEKEYIVKIGYKICNFAGTPRNNFDTEFTLTLKNPCHDPNRVSIGVPNPVLIDYEYIVKKQPAETTPAAHYDFPVTVTPNHSLCGAVKYVVKDDANAVVGGTDKPMAHLTADKKFTFDSMDTTLYDTTKTYTILASLAGYQTSATASTNSQTFNVKYIDPCRDPFSFTAPTQTGFTYLFTGSEATGSVTPFVVDPSDCAFEYACNSVTNPVKSPLRGSETSPACNNSLFDPSTLTVKINAGQTEYQGSTRTPGTITVNICGTVTKAESTSLNRQKCADFVITLDDPCDPPQTLTVNPTLLAKTNIDYIVTQPTTTYTLPAAPFTITPALCRYTTTFSDTKFGEANASSGVTY